MSDATLADVFDAVYGALEPYGPDGIEQRLFSVVTEFGGDLSHETIAQATDTRLPAALVALESDEVVESESVAATTRDMSRVTRVSLVVYVVAESLRGHRTLYRGHGSEPGLLALVGAVAGAVNGVDVPGGWGMARVRYAGTRPVPSLWRPGNAGALGVLAVRFTAERVAEQADLEAETEEFQRFDGEVNPIDASATADASALPLSTVRAEDLHD